MSMSTIFSAYDIRGRAGDTLSTEQAWNVGRAFAEWIPEEGNIVIASTENANESVVNALVEGLLLQGRNVVNKGAVTDQQAVISAIREEKGVGGMFISRDDLQNIEIISLFNSQGVAITSDNGLSDIAQLVEAANFMPPAEKGKLF